MYSKRTTVFGSWENEPVTVVLIRFSRLLSQEVMKETALSTVRAMGVTLVELIDYHKLQNTNAVHFAVS